MAQYRNEAHYTRMTRNRQIDRIVENSIDEMKCDCGGELKQKKRASFVVVCVVCKDEYKIED